MARALSHEWPTEGRYPQGPEVSNPPATAANRLTGQPEVPNVWRALPHSRTRRPRSVGIAPPERAASVAVGKVCERTPALRG
jgi:hypothetical protein